MCHRVLDAVWPIQQKAWKLADWRSRQFFAPLRRSLGWLREYRTTDYKLWLLFSAFPFPQGQLIVSGIGGKIRLDPVFRQNVKLLQLIQALAQLRLGKAQTLLPAGH